MDADVAGDDHLQARQADAGVGQHREVEGALRVGDVHHHLERRRRHLVEVGDVALEGQGARVDVAGVAFGAGNGDFLAVLDGVQCVAGADDSRHAQFARDDRGMAGAAAAIGDDGGRALHHRFPVGVGHVGDQHIARLHAAMSSSERTTRATPLPIFWPMARPSAMTSPRLVSE